MAEGDVGMHEALAMAQQAEYFAGQQEDPRMKWQAAFIMFIAFDFAATTRLPMAIRPAPYPPGTEQYHKVLLEPKIVNVNSYCKNLSFSTNRDILGL